MFALDSILSENLPSLWTPMKRGHSFLVWRTSLLKSNLTRCYHTSAAISAVEGWSQRFAKLPFWNRLDTKLERPSSTSTSWSLVTALDRYFTCCGSNDLPTTAICDRLTGSINYGLFSLPYNNCCTVTSRNL